MVELHLLTRGSRCLYGMVVFYLVLTSCSTQAHIPIVSDDAVELLVKNEAAQIVAASDDKYGVSHYQIFLSDFPRKDVLGMTFGNRRIYISHQLAKLASRRLSYLWLLRQTLAHEIAHETAGHAKQTGSNFSTLNKTLRDGVSNVDVGLPWNVRFRNYSMDKELEADSIGLGYWKKLGWDCRIWVQILQGFESQNYFGDVFHPTDKRLEQAQRLCFTEEKAGVI